MKEVPKKVGIYIHIPFCKKKCFYCDFVSFQDKEILMEAYVKALIAEIKIVACQIKNNVEINTIYIGGGTPSILDAKFINEIMNVLKEEFIIDENVEITIEVNPGTANKQKIEAYIRSGINRISIGLQTTQDILLKQIGRIHNYEQFLDTYNLAKEVGFNNINVDLMLGLPNQTLEQLEDSVNKIIELQPKHISIYSLILEEKTKLYEMVEKSEVEMLDEEVERKMYWKVKELLQKNNYIHYEISNFSKKRYESRHNMNCWKQEEYVGFGIGAHSYFNNVRYSNIENLDKYIETFSKENIKREEIVIIHEQQTIEEKQKEYMMLGLRKIDGVRISDFKNKFIQNPLYLFRKELDKLVKEDLIEIEEDVIKLTNKGLDLANVVFSEFI